jgi:hypothetical protein
MRKLTLVLCLLMIGIAAAMQAQIPTATVSGIVKDSQGALIQGAAVSVTSASRGISHESVSNSGGSFAIPDLTPGTYIASVSAKGFTTVKYDGVLLEAGRTFTLDTTLMPATQVTTVSVAASTQTVELEQSMLQGQIT